MIGRLFDTVFGCWHGNYSFPMSARSGSRRNPAACLTGTYVVCLDCGKELPYDWQDMKVISTDAERQHYAQAAVRHAA